MEKSKNRVLAYQLAVPIPNEALDDVSGGINMTSKQTLVATGNSAQGADVVWELVADF